MIFDGELLQTIVDEMTLQEKEKYSVILQMIQLYIVYTQVKVYGMNPNRNFPKEEEILDVACDVREFVEETRYSHKDIRLIDNLLPFEEIFIGSNQKVCNQKYYLAYNVRLIMSNNHIYPQTTDENWYILISIIIINWKFEKQAAFNNDPNKN